MASVRDSFACGDLRQPGFLLRVGAAEDQRAGGGERGGEQRRGGQRAAGLFQHQAEAQVAEVRAAVFLGDDDAGPAHLRHLGEGGRVVAERRAAVAHLAERGRPGDFSCVQVFAPRRAACLFFGQDGHVISFPQFDDGPMGSGRPRIRLEMMLFWISCEPP